MALALVIAACETDDTDDAPADDVEDEVEDTDDDATDDEVDDEATDDEAVDEDDDVVDEDDTTDETAVVEGELLTTTSSDDLGEVLANHAGLTVYIHALDQLEDGQPTCTGDCVALWAPVAAPPEGPEVGEGVDETLVDTVEREDADIIGVEYQLTYDGHPLYVFATDAEEGSTRGHELADIWFAIAPDGEPYGELPEDEELEELDMEEEEADE
jgi:predicted lipoprotein with Yx(FWY)xxD motif